MIPISHDNIKKILQTIREYISCFDEKQAFIVMFICEEIITNIIYHADFEDKIPKIKCNIKSKNNIELIFKDNAKEFNMLNYPDSDVTLDVESRSLGGLGIFLTKKFAKDIKYSYKDNYNILRIII